jgi:hypothetical protein
MHLLRKVGRVTQPRQQLVTDTGREIVTLPHLFEVAARFRLVAKLTRKAKSEAADISIFRLAQFAYCRPIIQLNLLTDVVQ